MEEIIVTLIKEPCCMVDDNKVEVDITMDDVREIIAALIITKFNKANIDGVIDFLEKLK